MTYRVSRSTRDIGVRMALGAHPAGVLSAVLRETGTIAISGLAFGIGATILASGALSDMLFGIAPRDPATLIGAAVSLALTLLLAGYFPARRASKVDPVIALRTE
jgi:ABC-type antimicrobial peptide transport system permease subunit